MSHLSDDMPIYGEWQELYIAVRDAVYVELFEQPVGVLLIEKEIVLGFHTPDVRKYTEYAVA